MKDTITYKHDDAANITGTSKKLVIKATYWRLVELFGEPEKLRDPDNARVMWSIEFSDGGVLTIYDWNEERRVEDVSQWNVGSHTFMMAARIYDILEGRPIIA